MRKKRQTKQRLEVSMRSISIRATPDYIEAVRRLARTRGVRAGDLTYTALEQMYGDQIRQYMASFVAPGGAKSSQMTTD